MINDVDELTITFTDDAFVQENAATIATSTYTLTDTTGVIDFGDAVLTYAGTFTESLVNDGSVTDSSIIATLTDDTFTGTNGDTLDSTVVEAATNVPLGLTAVFIRTSDTEVTLTLTGTADDA